MSSTRNRAPQLSTGMRTFSATPTEDWSSLLDVARAADTAGVDRLAMSDHVVFGENLEAYQDPARGGTRAVASSRLAPTGLGSIRSRRSLTSPR